MTKGALHFFIWNLEYIWHFLEYNILTSLLTKPSWFLSIVLNIFSMWDSSPRNSENESFPSKLVSRILKKPSTSLLKYSIFVMNKSKLFEKINGSLSNIKSITDMSNNFDNNKIAIKSYIPQIRT